MKFSDAPYPSFTLVLTSERVSFPGGSVLHFDPPVVPNYPKPPHKRLMSTISYESEQPIQALWPENELDTTSSLAGSEEVSVVPASAQEDNTDDVNQAKKLFSMLIEKMRIWHKSKASKTT